MKRSRDDVTSGAQKKKKVEVEPEEDSEDMMSDHSFSMDGDAEGLANELSEKVNTEFMPTLKRHLGSEIAKLLRLKLTSFTDQGSVVSQYSENLAIGKALVDSWQGVTLPTYVEAEKQLLRGDDAIKVWDQELVEEEIKLSKERFLLDVLDVEDSDDEEGASNGDNKLKKEDVTIDRCRLIPKLFVSDEVELNLRMIESALEQTTSGLISSEACPLIVTFWNHCLENAQDSFGQDDYKEAFITLLALSQTLLFDTPFWVSENKKPQSVVQTMNDLAKAWKKCLSKPFEELDVVGAREDLIQWLEKGANEVSEVQKATHGTSKIVWDLK